MLNSRQLEQRLDLDYDFLPDELQGEVGEALIGLFEKELGTLLDKAL